MHKRLNRLTIARFLVAGFACAGGFAAATASAESLVPHSAEYKVKFSVLSGRLDTRLSSSDGYYAAIHRIEPTGLAGLVADGSIEEMARFRIADDRVVPQSYQSNDTLTSDKTKADVEFDWDERRLEGTVDNAAYSHALEEFAHDRVSIQYQLMHDLLTGDKAETYVLYDIDEFKTLEISTLEARDMKVPAGGFRVVGVQHSGRGSSRVTTLWCAEELGYLPVVIEQHRDGKLQLRATLTSYTPESGPKVASSGQPDR